MNGQREAGTRLSATHIAALTASILCGAMQFWLMPPLTSLMLERRDVGTAWIGLVGAAPWIGLVLATPLIAHAIARFGLRRVYRAGIGLSAAVVIGFLATAALPMWLVLNAVLGIGLGLRWIAADTFVTGVVPAAQRGVLLGAYETLAAGAIGLGPLVLALTGTLGWLPYGAALLLLAVQFAGSFALPDQPMETAAVPWWRAAAQVAHADRSILIAAFLCGVLEGIATSVLPVYGVRSGLSGDNAALLVTALGAGSIASQIPLGMLTDRLGLRIMYGAAGVTVAVLGTLLPLALGSLVAAWLLLAAWGGLAAGLFLFALIGAGQIFSGIALVHAVAGLAVTYTLGGALGPLLGSLGLALHPVAGMPAILGMAASVGTIILLVQSRPSGA